MSVSAKRLVCTLCRLPHRFASCCPGHRAADAYHSAHAQAYRQRAAGPSPCTCARRCSWASTRARAACPACWTPRCRARQRCWRCAGRAARCCTRRRPTWAPRCAPPAACSLARPQLPVGRQAASTSVHLPRPWPHRELQAAVQGACVVASRSARGPPRPASSLAPVRAAGNPAVPGAQRSQSHCLSGWPSRRATSRSRSGSVRATRPSSRSWRPCWVLCSMWRRPQARRSGADQRRQAAGPSGLQPHGARVQCVAVVLQGPGLLTMLLRVPVELQGAGARALNASTQLHGCSLCSLLEQQRRLHG